MFSVNDRDTIIDEVEENKQKTPRDFTSPVKIGGGEYGSSIAQTLQHKKEINVSNYSKVPLRASSQFQNQSELVKIQKTNLAPSTTRFEEQDPSDLGNAIMHELDKEIIEDSLEHLPEQLLDFDPLELFDENKKCQVFD